MYNFILQIIIMLSLGTVIYLIGRAAPRVNDVEETSRETFHAKLDKLITKLPMDKIDIYLVSFLEKALRKIKLLLMKWDNIVSGHLGKIKKANSNNAQKEEKPSLFDSEQSLSENKKEEEN